MKNKNNKTFLLSVLVFSYTLALGMVLAPKQVAADVNEVRPIVFPVLGSAWYVNDYNYSRSGGRIHQATDVMANQMQALVSTVDGTVKWVAYPQPSWGYAIAIEDNAGYVYTYLHMNNDTPGTRDNKSDPMYAYAADMKPGNKVVKGQLIGFVGDSGNSNGVDHLHFEMEAPDGSPINPYYSLRQAQIIDRPAIQPKMPNETLPYGADFRGGSAIAMGQLDGDAFSEYVTGARAGGGPHVRVFDENNAYLTAGFMAYNQHMRSGIDVAVGDTDGDGTSEIITAPGYGAGPHIKVFNLNGTLKSEFFAYSSQFWGGVSVETGDIDGDGTEEIITGAGRGGGPHVRVFSEDGTILGGFFAYKADFRGGIDVASADLTGDGTAEIVTSPGPGGGPHIRIFDATGSVLYGFQAYLESFKGGVRVSAGNVDQNSAESEILVAPASYGGPEIKLFDVAGQLIDVDMFLESWWSGFYDVAAGEGYSIASTGFNRRTSIREAFDYLP